MKSNPIRTCVGCKKEFNKNDLIRIVRQKDGRVLVDFSSKVNGRGVYLCKDEKCLNEAYKTKRMDKSLKIKIDDSIYNQLRNEIKDGQ